MDFSAIPELTVDYKTSYFIPPRQNVNREAHSPWLRATWECGRNGWSQPVRLDSAGGLADNGLKGKTMKKTAILAVTILLLAAASAPASVSFKLKGGVTYVLASEYNAGLRGAYDLMAETLGGAMGEYRPLHIGPEFGGEFIVPIGGGFSLGLGAGWLRATRESLIGYDWLTFSARQTLLPRVSAVPIVLNLHREWMLGDALHLDVFAGAGFTLASFSQEFRTTTNFFSYAETQTFSGRKSAFGGQGGVSLELDLGRRVALFVQAEGRLASLTNLQGDAAEQGDWFLGSWTGGKGTAFLWTYTLTDSGQAYPQLAVSLDAPSGAGISNVAKARIDLSGVSLSAGIKIRL
jgi:hypothetical protein